jgi:hypothetical protein
MSVLAEGHVEGGRVSRQAETARAWFLALVALLLVGLGMIIYFDLRLALPFNDEWFYRWSITELVAGRGVRLWPGALPPNFVQIAAGAVPLLLGLPIQATRLTVLPFVIAQVGFAWWCARQLGCNRFWAGVAALAVALSPLELAVATGLMSDVAYLAFLAAAAAFGLRWINGGGGRLGCVVFAVLAALQRQHAAGILVALSVALPLSGRLRDRADRWSLATLWIAVTAALAFPLVTGLATPSFRAVATAAPPLKIAADAAGVVTLSATMLGLIALPLAMASWHRTAGERVLRSRWALIPFVLAEAGFLSAVVFAVRYGNMIFPGDYFGNWGLGTLHMTGPKPAVWPLIPFLIFEIVVVAAFLVMLGRRRRIWIPDSLGPGALMMTTLGLTQLVPMLSTGATDRYYLAVALVITPVIASSVSAVSALRLSSKLWALGALGGSLFLYGVSQDDFEAWQGARDVAAQGAYAAAMSRHLSASAVEGGWEEDGVHYLLPTYIRTGRAPAYEGAGLPGATIRVMFSGRGDPRPGQDYTSVAPGRIVWADSK